MSNAITRLTDTEHAVSKGELESVFAQAVREAFAQGWTNMDISFRLADRARELGMADAAIDRTIEEEAAAAERKQRQEEERRKSEQTETSGGSGAGAGGGGGADQFAVNRGLAALFVRRETSRFLNLEPVALPWPADDWRGDFTRLLEAAFLPEETFALSQSAESRSAVIKAGDMQTRDEGAIAATLRKLDNGTSGVRINPSRGDRETDVLAYRHALLENRTLELGRQLAFYRALNLPCTALVNAGGDAIQAWVRIDARDLGEYVSRLNDMLKVLEDCGFEVESSVNDPLMRAAVPGTMSNKRQQYLLGLNEGASSYEEWKLWADAYLDGMPLIDRASQIAEPPEESLELLEGVFRESHRVVLRGPARCGKSLAALDLALSIASGEQWLGQATEESSVLFVNMESTPSNLIRRAFQIAEARGFEAAHERFDYLHLMGIEKNVAELADLIVKRVEAGRKWHQRPYSMIVLDGLGRYLPEREGMLTTGGDPVSTSLALDRIAVRTEAAVLVVLRDDQAERLQLPVDAEIRMVPDGSETRFEATTIHYPPLEPVRCRFDVPVFTRI